MARMRREYRMSNKERRNRKGWKSTDPVLGPRSWLALFQVELESLERGGRELPGGFSAATTLTAVCHR